MYPQIPCDLIAYALISANHTLGTTDLADPFAPVSFRNDTILIGTRKA